MCAHLCARFRLPARGDYRWAILASLSLSRCLVSIGATDYTATAGLLAREPPLLEEGGESLQQTYASLLRAAALWRSMRRWWRIAATRAPA